MSANARTWTAADVMRVGVHTVPSSMPLPEFEEQLVAKRVSGFLVVDEGLLVGVVSRADVIRQICAEREVAERTSDFYYDDLGFHEQPMESFSAIADRIGERLEALTVADVMSRQPWTVPLDLPLVEVARKFLEQRIHRMPVTDDGTLVGIVTTVDLVRMIADGRLVPRSS